jgi:type IV secretion system protein VirD4
MLDNRYALLFIRGERPVMDEKFDILRHPNVGGTADGKGERFRHGEVTRSVATLTFGEITGAADTPEPALPDSAYALYSEEDLEELYENKEAI